MSKEKTPETETESDTAIFEQVESNVRGYCRSFPTVFNSAKNAILRNEQGEEYIDFLAGAGSLNYGHNNDVIKEGLMDYIAKDGVTHGLDMFTNAKREFLQAMNDGILQPREMDYKIQFTGPTGTNAVEAALKIARNYTGRSNVVSFTNGFHGMTLGSVACTGNSHYRDAAGVEHNNVTFMPYDGYLGPQLNTLAYFEKALLDNSSGLDKPAAVIVESIQGEGGVNEASYAWLRGLERLCREHEIVFIMDDIQVGCGRTGTFFSFEEAGVEPDVITLSKSLSAYGLPLSVVLMRPHLDIWESGQHNGTFRGNNMAFVTATIAIRHFWRNMEFTKSIAEKSYAIGQRLQDMREIYPGILGVRGRGMILGMECTPAELAGAVTAECFERGLILETCGANDQVIKFLPALTVETEVLERGMDIFEKSFAAALEGFPQHKIKRAIAGAQA